MKFFPSIVLPPYSILPPFNLALSKLDVDAASSMYVGDQILSDIEGAKKSKMLPLLIDRDSSHSDYQGQKISNLSQF